ncbi:hypothetical protein K432DRAFT_355207 [Lepidopterella palustris CBS 459.81]|uniref:ABM domain-containing protein n=1 Tax=Lepidopterella palustris CBS 459.81 TaxID=1314670 RepID=A0A8E2E8R2_9PEZI|nr:hypothetical protein K432DRAFT_355207 [Lepidopterella palustris CBS 459.81]
MPPQATEIATLPLIAGAKLDSGDIGKLWDDALNTIAKTPGYQKMFWGRQVEHPDVLQLCIDWDSIEAHQAFMASPAYGPFGQGLGKILGGPPNLYHINLPPSSPFSGPAAAPVTELVSLYFPPDFATEEFDLNWIKFQGLIQNSAEGYHGSTGAWSVEEATYKGMGKDGAEGPAKLFFASIGWDSVDAHMKYRETDAFKDAIPLLRQGCSAIEMYHVKFATY